MKTKFFIGMLFALLVFGGITVFADTDGVYVYSVSNGAATITGVVDKTAFSGSQVIPEMLGGYPVKNISSSAFKDCTSLTSVTVPESVTSVGSGAFDGCTALGELTIPKIYGSRLGYLFGSTTKKDTYSRKGFDNPNPSYGKASYIPNGTTYQKYYITSKDASDSSRYIYTYYYYYIPASLKKVTVTNATSIGECAFYNCENIKSVILNDKITRIGDEAFYNCGWYNSLTDEFSTVGDGVLIKYNSENQSVIIPESVKHIAPRVFYNRTDITDIALPSELKSIGTYAFYGVKQVSTYTIPKTVTLIGDSAFNADTNIKCYSGSRAQRYAEINSLAVSIINLTETIGEDTFYYIINDDGTAEIVGCETTSTSITIPLRLGGANVTKIGDGGFENCKTITGVTITDYITEIGKSAFYGCTSIENVTVPTTVKSVGEYAFYGCVKLETVTISEGLKSIGGYAFYNCSSLSEITLPDTLKTLGSYAFYGCTSAKSATIGVNLIGIEEYTFYGCTELSTVVVGTSVGYIGNYAFFGTAVKKITLPAATKSIGNHAFENCSALTAMQIRNGLETIGDYAFSKNERLSKISFPASINKIGEYAFNDCVMLTEFAIPDAVTRIENSTFNGCSALSDLILGKNTLYIGKNAFCGCAFSELTLPNTVTEIDDNAFSDNKYLTEIYIPDETERLGIGVFYNCNALKSVSVADKLLSIGSSSFYMTDSIFAEIRNVCGSVTNGLFENQTVYAVTINEGITKVGDRAFFGCQTLKTVNFPQSLNAVGSYAFYDNIGYCKVNLPDNTEYIGEKAYGNCTRLTNISFSDKMKEIGLDAFYNCKNLAADIRCVDKSIDEGLFCGQNVFTVSFPDTITSVGNSAFAAKNDIDLTIAYENGIIANELLKNENGVNKSGTVSKIYIGDGIGEIGNSAFYGSSFDDIHIYGNLENVGENAFKNSAFKNAYFNGNVDFVGNGAFENSTINAVVFEKNVGELGENAFKNTTELKTAEFKGNVNIIGKNAFEQSLLKKAEIKGNVSKADDYAFYNCLKLEEVIFGGELETIGSHTFDGCKILPKLKLPETVTEIGSYAFYDCNQMAGINIPEKVSKINEYTFYGCANLKEANLSDNITFVGGYAYYGCTALEKLTLCEKVKSVGEYAFYNCNTLTNIFLPNGIENIGNYAFRGCIGISSIIIPDSAIYLGDGAFYACTGLEKVYVGSKITSINDKMFYGCVALKKAVISDNTEYIEDYAFYGCDDCKLYCAQNSYVEEYAEFNFLNYHNTNGEFKLSVTAPDKTEYYQGDELDLTGLAVTADYNGDAVEIMFGYSVSGFNSEILGEQTVLVEYKGQKAEFTVNVIVRNCEEISVIPPQKVTYYTGQALDLTGMTVTASFSGGKTIVIDAGYSISGYDSTMPGEQTITVIYGEKTAQFVVTVIQKAIKSISVTNLKDTYMQNESFSTSALRVTVNYNDGETSNLLFDENTMKITGFNSSEICEKQTLTLTYGGFEATFNIAIVKKIVPLTTTTTRIGTNYTRFYVNFKEEISNAVIIVSVGDSKQVESLTTMPCDGDVSYTLTIPSLTVSKTAKVFVWSGLDAMVPKGIPEIVEIK